MCLPLCYSHLCKFVHWIVHDLHLPLTSRYINQGWREAELTYYILIINPLKSTNIGKCYFILSYSLFLFDSNQKGQELSRASFFCYPLYGVGLQVWVGGCVGVGQARSPGYGRRTNLVRTRFDCYLQYHPNM